MAYIRQHHGTFFSVGVAGYPEGHPNRITRVEEEELAGLTEAEKGRMAVERGGCDCVRWFVDYWEAVVGAIELISPSILL